MAGHLTSHSYGKHRVRVSKVRRPRQTAPNTEQHHFVEATVDIELEGAFDASFTDGDNRAVIATDTCKNTVYALAKDDFLNTIESFGLTIAKYFVEQFSQVDCCHVSLSERVWTRLLNSPHAFIANDRATPNAKVSRAKGEQSVVRAGIEHMLIAKTTESGFSDFDPSEFRTLADSDDRIFATELSALWSYASVEINSSVEIENSVEIDFAANRKAIVDALLAKFVDHYSRSVQETLHLMGQAALDACSEATEIKLTMPNKHHILADLSPYGRENENEVFVVTDEPFGYISATIARE